MDILNKRIINKIEFNQLRDQAEILFLRLKVHKLDFYNLQIIKYRIVI